MYSHGRLETALPRKPHPAAAAGTRLRYEAGGRKELPLGWRGGDRKREEQEPDVRR